jgi:hypothetical protein
MPGGVVEAPPGGGGIGGMLGGIGHMLGGIFGTTRPRGQRLSPGQLVAREVTRSVTNRVAGQIAGNLGKSLGGSMGNTIGRAIVRGTLGGFCGGEPSSVSCPHSRVIYNIRCHAPRKRGIQ